MEFKSQDDEIKYWRLKNKVDQLTIELLKANQRLKDFENEIF